MVSLLVEAQAELGQSRAARGFAVVRHSAADDLQRRVGGIERLDLVLVEPADLQLLPARMIAGLNVKRAGDHLGEGRLAGAVDAQQADAVVDVQPQVEVLAGSACAVIADIGALQPHQRRRERALGRGQGEGRDALLDDRGDRLQLGQPLHARLGLGRLARPWRGSGRRRSAGGRARPPACCARRSAGAASRRRRRSKSS